MNAFARRLLLARARRPSSWQAYLYESRLGWTAELHRPTGDARRPHCLCFSRERMTRGAALAALTYAALKQLADEERAGALAALTELDRAEVAAP